MVPRLAEADTVRNGQKADVPNAGYRQFNSGKAKMLTRSGGAEFGKSAFSKCVPLELE